MAPACRVHDYAARPCTRRLLRRAWLPQHPQGIPESVLQRVPDPDVTRVLGQVGGRPIAPVALGDGDTDLGVSVGVGEARISRACSPHGRSGPSGLGCTPGGSSRSPPCRATSRHARRPAYRGATRMTTGQLAQPVPGHAAVDGRALVGRRLREVAAVVCSRDGHGSVSAFARTSISVTVRSSSAMRAGVCAGLARYAATRRR